MRNYLKLGKRLLVNKTVCPGIYSDYFKSFQFCYTVYLRGQFSNNGGNRLWNTYVALIVNRLVASCRCDLNFLPVCVYRYGASTMAQFGSEIQLLKYVPAYRKAFCRNPITFFRLHQVSFIYFFPSLKN